MYSILIFGIFLLISTSVMTSPIAYETDDGLVNDDIQHLFRRHEEVIPWFYKRNNPLCDYRLQFRPLPLTSALCGYGNNNKGEAATNINPFKYG